MTSSASSGNKQDPQKPRNTAFFFLPDQKVAYHSFRIVIGTKKNVRKKMYA